MTTPRPQDTDPLRPPEELPPQWRPPAVPATGRSTKPRRSGCSVFGWLALAVVVLATMSTATPSGESDEAHQAEGRTLQVSGQAPALRGAPHAISAAVVTTAGTSLGGAPPPAEPLQLAGGTRTGTAADVTYSGIINYADPRHGRFYLAIPDGRGVRVEICGPAGCLIRTSTDAGPALHMQRAGRIADLNSVDWQEISGVPLRFGGFQGTILILKRPPRIALPATDTKEPRP